MAARTARAGRVWSDDDLLDAIRAWTALHGSVPAMLDWDVYRARRAGHQWRVDRYVAGDWPSTRTVCARLGSFGNAIRSAGLEPRPQGARLTRTAPAAPVPTTVLAVHTTETGFAAALSARVREVASAQASGASEELRFALFGLARQALAWAQAEEQPDRLRSPDIAQDRLAG